MVRPPDSDMLLNQLDRFLPGYIYRRRADDCSRLLALDGKVEEITGWSVDSLMQPGALAARIFPADLNTVQEIIHDAIRRQGQFELEYRIVPPQGEPRWVWETGIVHGEDVLGFVSDCLPGLGRRRHLLEAQRRVLDVATSEHVSGGDLMAVAEAICQACTDWLKVQRASVWLLSEDQSQLDLLTLLSSENPERITGVCVRRDDYPEYFASLVTGRAIDADHARTDPRTSEFSESYLVPRDIYSMLDAAVRSGERILGVLCCEQTGTPRHWTPDDINFAAELADQFAHTLANKRTREAREEALRADAANQAKSHFLATMTHELRTPLNGVLGLTDLLRDTRLDAEQTEIVDTLVQSGELLLSVINDVLDFSRIEAGKLDISKAAVDLHELIDSCMSIFRSPVASKGLTLCSQLPPDLPLLNLDGPRLQQVLVNLLGNAVKFSHQGCIEISAKISEGRLQIEVRDEGEGISDELLQRLFQPFEQARRHLGQEYVQGTGLGLAISKRIIEAMQGSISVRSKAGVGSTFRIELPAEATSEKQIATPDSTELTSLQLDVWVAEDNPVNQIVIAGMLRQRGIIAKLFENGERLLHGLHESEQLPDLILMDCEMPVLDGFETSRKIRADTRLKALPIVALTAHIMPEFRQRSEAAGMNDYLSKPVQRQELSRILMQFQKDR